MKNTIDRVLAVVRSRRRSAWFSNTCSPRGRPAKASYVSDSIIRRRVLPFSVSARAQCPLEIRNLRTREGQFNRVARLNSRAWNTRANYAPPTMGDFTVGGTMRRPGKDRSVAGAVSAPSDRGHGSVSSLMRLRSAARRAAGGGREMMSPLTHVHRIRPRAILLSAQTALS